MQNIAKLFRFGDLGQEKPGVVLKSPAGAHVDVSAFGQDFNGSFFADDGLKRLDSWVGAQRNGSLPKVDPTAVRLGAPICRPQNFICVGLNYGRHADESQLPIPQEPVLFMKHSGSYHGPFDDVLIPANSVKTDYEVELALVIGRDAHRVSKENWRDYVAGVTLMDDVSEREWQIERGGTWDKGKGFPTFSPLGPYFVPTDEIGNPNELRLWLKVNGEMRQDWNTNDMIFDVPTVVSYASTCFGLLSGDVISTGTPHGVGIGQKPEPIYLKDGDVVELGIERIGEAKHVFRQG